MSVAELASKAGFSAPYVSQMALGSRNISLKNLERLATALGCRPEDLLGSPTPTNTDILNIWAAIPVDRRDLALQVLRNFTNDETNSNQHDKTEPGTTKRRHNRNPK